MGVGGIFLEHEGGCWGSRYVVGVVLTLLNVEFDTKKISKKLPVF